MEWFGPDSWGAHVNEACPRTAIPIGEHCGHCEQLFTEIDIGLVMPQLSTSIVAGRYVEGTVAFHHRCVLAMLGLRGEDHPSPAPAIEQHRDQE